MVEAVVSTGELAHMARRCVEDPLRDVPRELQVGVGNTIYGQYYSYRCLSQKTRIEQFDKLDEHWAKVNWSICIRCGRKVTRARSVRRRMGDHCYGIVVAEARRLEIQQLREEVI